MSEEGWKKFIQQMPPGNMDQWCISADETDSSARDTGELNVTDLAFALLAEQEVQKASRTRVDPYSITFGTFSENEQSAYQGLLVPHALGNSGQRGLHGLEALLQQLTPQQKQHELVTLYTNLPEWCRLPTENSFVFSEALAQTTHNHMNYLRAVQGAFTSIIGLSDTTNSFKAMMLQVFQDTCLRGRTNAIPEKKHMRTFDEHGLLQMLDLDKPYSEGIFSHPVDKERKLYMIMLSKLESFVTGYLKMGENPFVPDDTIPAGPYELNVRMRQWQLDFAHKYPEQDELPTTWFILQ